MMEQTLVLLKPDGVAKGLLGPVANCFVREGLVLAAIRMEWLTRERAEQFYAVHAGREYFDRLCKFMSCGPLIAMVWCGDDAVARARAVMGATDYQQAVPGTIRAEYARHITFNVVHGSDSPENVGTEIAFFFTPEQIHTVPEGVPGT